MESLKWVSKGTKNQLGFADDMQSCTGLC